MGLISINLDETPDEMPQAQPGIRILKVVAISDEVGKSSGKPYTKVELQIEEDDAEDNGTKLWENFSLGNPMGQISFKKFIMAAGHAGTGQEVDPTEIVGCTVKAALVGRTYTQDGVTKEGIEVREYILP